MVGGELPDLDSDNIMSRLMSVFSLRLEVAQKTLHPDFVRYFRAFFAGKDASIYWKHLAAAKDIAQWHGTLLDLGCGFGVTTVFYRHLGIKRVVGMDYEADVAGTGARLANYVNANGVEFVTGSAEHLPFGNESFDGVLAKEMISHLCADTYCYSEVFRILKRGGAFVVRDDRNSINPRVRRATKRIWVQTEFGTSQQIAVFGKKENFCSMRERYLLENFPELPRAKCARVARMSRGYTNAQLKTIVGTGRDFARTAPQPFAPCVDPETGIVHERLVNPLTLVRQLQSIGFMARIVAPPGWVASNSARSRFKRFLAGAMGPYSVCLMDEFWILAVKP